MIRRVGPKPVTNALAAEVLAPAWSTRTADTETSSSPGERQELVPQSAGRERGRAKEQRQDHDRRHRREHELERHDSAGRDQPPGVWPLALNGNEQRDEGNAEQRRR